MSVEYTEVVTGEAAHDLLGDSQFLAAWQSLHAICPHATNLQAPAFVCTWYEAYRSRWQPVIVRSSASDGALAGLWLLAHDPTQQTLAHAGAHQAEYQVWLALPGTDVAFLTSAWAEIQRHLPFETLRFRYLPAFALLGTLRAVPGMKNRLTARIHRRPLAMLDPADIKASFAKKSNKSRFNRLKRLGRLEFRRLTDPAEFERIYDEFIVYYDFRQGAVHQATPFRQDPLKREFHRALFLASATDERHLTVTYLDGRMIAAFWGSVSGKMVHLGMLVHSPLLGEHSPGKLHLMLLADHLLKEGKEVLDMTPGGAPWKERFANAHDDVADVLLYRSAFARKRIEMQARLLQEANRCAARVGVQPAHIRGVLAKLTSIRSSLAVNRASEDRELRVYRADRAVGNRSSCDTQIACNSVSHLLCFEGGGPSQSRDVFLSDALSRLERGETVYTMCSDDRLAHCCWMIRNQTKLHMAEVQQSVQLPPRSVVLCNYYTHPDFRTAECYRAMFETMLAEAYTDISTRHVFIAMPAENLPMRNLIEALDFQYRGSLSWNGHLGAKTNSAYVLCGQDQTFAQAETANK